jgi:hypothetical protein
MRSVFRRIAALAGLVAFVALTTPVGADHSWGGYHWARTAKRFTLQLGDSMSSEWDTHLAIAASDWSLSKVLDTPVVNTTVKQPQACRPSLGRVEVCNGWWGFNLWVGLARIWITNNRHIVQGVAQMNDAYFSLPRYNTFAYRQLVVCQEIGHTFGLDHQDEDFGNAPLGTCMDYSRIVEPNQHPNAHDYDQLELIYKHIDTTTTVAALPSAMTDVDYTNTPPSQWGRVVDRDANGRPSKYELDFGGGNKIVTFVVWAEK